MNKWSSNVIATQVLATLGATDQNALDVLTSGANVVKERLLASGIPAEDLIIENGSGLSRHERISANCLGKLLMTAWQRPFMPEFVSSLPIAGLDGTARNRLSASPARGQAHIKTGTLEGVRAIAGYVLDRKGRRHALVMMVNDPAAASSLEAQEALLEWIWADR
jgi:D-alanyl-D-alanine carboxypeptidase/D-alanyl-D-alanine-endopeptidase (penicillin-binding protein 4)